MTNELVATNEPIYAYVGSDRRGTARTGRIAISDLAAFTEQRFRSGWQSLKVYADPDTQLCIVAEIGTRYDERIWWAEG